MGPDKNYYKVANFSIGQTTQVMGQGDDSKWLNVLTPAPNNISTCWVPLASVEHFPSAKSLQVIKAAALPDGVTLVVAYQKFTCHDDQDVSVLLGWSPSATDKGYNVYRNGEKIATVYGGEYIDHQPASKTPYLLTYVIQAVNPVGISQFTTVTSVTSCYYKIGFPYIKDRLFLR